MFKKKKRSVNLQYINLESTLDTKVKNSGKSCNIYIVMTEEGWRGWGAEFTETAGWAVCVSADSFRNVFFYSKTNLNTH